MLEKGIVAAILVVSAFIFFLFIWKLWRCWSQSRRDQTSDEASEPLILEVEDVPAVQTLKRAVVCDHSLNRPSKAPEVSEAVALDFDIHEPKSRNTITLEVISGPSTGTRVSHPSGQSVTVGRISQNNLVLNDPEVSGKHACIKWNSQKSVWELMDMGSLNGTSINDQAISLNQSRSTALRKPGIPVKLGTGDIVSLGATSRVLVQVCNDKKGSTSNIRSCPFEVGVASDPMALRRGGKRLFMEDVCFCEWPLRGLQQFGAFCVFDGHGGVAAAEAASKILPQKLFDFLRVDAKRSEVLHNCNATDVLKAAFNATEEALDHEYEGCTATILLVWLDCNNIAYAQCANVGDSACIISVGGKYVSMTEDHRLTSIPERSRMLEMGKQLHDGETRLCGMNIARALGDKFLKEQDVRFSSQPFVSEVLQITKDSKALAIIASDGLWDVLSQRRALQLALEARDGHHLNEGTEEGPLSAKGIAELLVNKARLLRTKDNTSVIVLDFVRGLKPSFNAM